MQKLELFSSTGSAFGSLRHSQKQRPKIAPGPGREANPQRCNQRRGGRGRERGSKSVASGGEPRSSWNVFVPRSEAHRTLPRVPGKHSKRLPPARHQVTLHREAPLPGRRRHARGPQGWLELAQTRRARRQLSQPQIAPQGCCTRALALTPRMASLPLSGLLPWGAKSNADVLGTRGCVSDPKAFGGRFALCLCHVIRWAKISHERENCVPFA